MKGKHGMAVQKQFNESEFRQHLRAVKKKMVKIAKAHGYKGDWPTQEQREKWAMEFDKKKGLI